MFRGKLHFKKVLFLGLISLSQFAFAETQNALSLTVPSFTPGTAGAFNTSQLSGAAATGSGTLTYTYAGLVQMGLSSGTGRFGSLGNITRMGLGFDSFILFQSFLTTNYLTVASNNTTCPDATEYNWLTVRFRTPDLARNPNNTASTNFFVGGTVSYDPNGSPLFTGENYFDLVGPTLTANPTYGYTGFNSASCNSGNMKIEATQADRPLMQYGTLYFGSHGFVYLDYTGNPMVMVGLPKQTLTSNIMGDFVGNVLTGRYTYFTNYNTQDQRNVYFYPDGSGTSFTIKEASDLTDPTQQATLGALTCTSLNSPTTGFCSGTLTLDGVTGTGNAVCELYNGADEQILACSAQYPAAPSRPVSFILSTPKRALLAVTLSGNAQTVDENNTTTVTATLTNMTGRKIPTMGNPAASSSCPGTQDGALCAPFSNTGAFAGNSNSGGACGTSLSGYGSCTVTLNYEPSALGAQLQTYRVAYASGSTGTLNGTSKLVGAAGLTSIAVTPSTANFAQGATQQFTATATYSDNSTQNITSAVTWSSGNNKATITSTGLATWVTPGSASITATLGNVSGLVTPTVVVTPVLTSVSNKNFPSNFLNQGSTLSIDFDNTATGDDTGMTYACVFDQVVNGAVNAGTACTSLPGTASLNTSTGAFAWTPDASAWGAYEIKVTGTNSASLTATRIFVVDVRPAYVTTNLRGNWDAQFADLTAPYSSANTNWQDLTSNDRDGTLSSTSHASWGGSGAYSSPYALSLDGQGYVDFGSSPLASQSKMMFTSWVKSSDVAASGNGADSVILGNSSNATGNGFTVRQHPSYRDVVMSLSPVGYWRLGESSGTTATDLGSGGNNGTYTNGPTLAQAGVLTGDIDTAVSFDGSNDYVVGNTNLGISGDATFSMSAWIYWSGASWSGDYPSFMGNNTTGTNHGLSFTVNDGKPAIDFWCTRWRATDALNVQQWYHIVGTKTPGSMSSANSKIYIDGKLVPGSWDAAGCSGVTNDPPNITDSAWVIGRLDGSRYFQGIVDEAAVFNSELTAAQVASLYQAGKTGKKMDFVVGKSYQDVVLADSPVGYWRLGESSGPTAKDISGYGNNAAYEPHDPTFGNAGAIAGDTTTSVRIYDTYRYGANIFRASPLLGLGTPNEITLEAWMKWDGSNGGLTSGRGIIEVSGYPNTFAFLVAGETAHVATVKFLVGSWHTVNGTTSIDDNNWHHIVATYDNSNLKLYVDGNLDATPLNSPGMTLQNVSFTIGMTLYHDTLGSYMQEVAVYPTALGSADVLAHYNAGLATYGGICRSTSSFSDNLWNSVAGIFSGSAAKFFVNGREECTTTISNGFASPNSNLFAGATDTNIKNFTGSIADLKVYGTSNGSAVGTATDVKTNFDKTADRFRKNPTGNIVFDDLVLHMDAANARNGLRAYSNGCAASDLSWFDLSSTGATGTLTSFASCGSTEGWNGSGTASSPYALSFDGTADYVTIPNAAALNPSSAITIASWVRPTSGNFDGQKPILMKAFTSHADPYYQYALLMADSVTYPRALTMYLSLGGSLVAYPKTDTQWSYNQWNYMVGTYDGSNIKIYRNGVLLGTEPASGALGSYATPIEIGKYPNLAQDSSTVFGGDIGSVSVYEDDLSAAEIKQNFDAQADRYRTTPVGNIVKDGLVLNLDAANAAGVAAYANGCAATDNWWFDLSPSSLLGTLTNFSSCGGTTGWNGDGTSGDPYRLTFDGSDDYVTLGNPAALDLDGTSNLSICTWIQTTNTGQNYPIIISKQTGGSGQWSLNAAEGTNSKPTLFLNTGSWGKAVGATTALDANTWYHVCGTYDGSDAKIYLNGSEDATASVSGNIQNSTAANVYVGSFEGAIPFAGHLNGLMIYRRTLTPSEISQNCNALKSRFSGANCN